MDEPFAAIDAKVRQELRSWLKELIQSVGITSIFVTHDQDEAFEVADTIIVTNHGRIEQVGSPLEIYKNPKTPFVAQFIGQSIQIDNPTDFHGFKNIPKDAKGIIRPEFIEIYRRGQKFKYEATSDKGVVEHIYFRGMDIDIKIRVNDTVLTVKRRVDEPSIEVGDEVSVFLSKMFVVEGDKVTSVNNETLEAENNIYSI